MTLRLLLVDDDKDFLKIANLYLKKLMPDAECTSVTSAEEARTTLSRSHYDAIICDYQMPGTDGLELLKSLRDSENDVPFIILTAHSREDIAIRALNLGATHYLTKGTDAKLVYAELKHVIESSVEFVRAKRSLLDSEQKYRSTIHSIGDALHVVDRNLRILVTNEAFEDWLKSLGLGADIVGKTIKEAFPFLSDSVAQEYQQVFERGVPLNTVEKTEVGGSAIWTETRKFPVLTEGVVTQVVTVLRDVTKQRENEERLRTNEQKYKTLISSMTDVVFVYDNENRYSQYYASDASLLYTEPEKFMRRKIDEVLPTRVANEMNAGIEKVRVTKQPQTLDYALRISGREIWFSANLTLHEDGTSVVAVVRDITDRKKTEEALRVSEARYRGIFEGAAEGVFVADQSTMTFTSANTALCRMVGYAETELMRMSVNDVILDETVVTRLQESASVNSRRMASNVACARKSGEVFDADISHALIDVEGRRSVVGFLTDVTERKRQERALRRSEEWFRSIFDDSPIAINVFDSSGRLIDANQACLDFAGVSRVEDLKNFNLLEDPNMSIGMRESLMRGEQVTAESIMDFDLIRKLGVYPTTKSGAAHIRVAYSPLSLQGEVVNYIVQIIDVTELKRQRDELSAFAHSMAHDLRSGIHNLQGYATLIQEDKDPSYASEIAKIAASMNEILTKSVTLADSGLVVSAPEQVDLNEVVAEVASRVVPDDVRLTLLPLPRLMCDRSKIIQAVQNLMINAIEHGKPANITVEAQRTTAGVDLLFRNDGFRIPSAQREKLFERGFSTKAGGGLGLTIVRRILEAHGWVILLDPEEVTTFRIRIPARSVA